MDRQEHREKVYRTRRPDEVSWFQPHAALSVELIVSGLPDRAAPILEATFAEDGPTRCSGLEVARYRPSRLLADLGTEFELLESRREEHHTPTGAMQPFTYCLCRLSSTRSTTHFM
jgi:hypothetical protein